MPRSSQPIHGPKPSAVAIALCILIVAGSVLFGIFGPGIAQRSLLGGGISLGDLVGGAVAQRDRLLLRALEGLRPVPRGTGDAPIAIEQMTRDRAAAESLIERTLGTEVPIPDLAPFGFELETWSAMTLPGSSREGFAIGYLDRDHSSFLALFVVPDDGRFVAFDSFGRPVPLTPDRVYEEELARSRRDESLALVWSTGPFLWIAVVDSRSDALKLHEALGAP